VSNPSYRLGHRSRLSRLLLLLACAWFVAGCATYHIYQVKGPLEMGNQPLTEWKTKTLHSLVWGAVRQDLPVDNCKLGNGTRTNIERCASDPTSAPRSPRSSPWGCGSPCRSAGAARGLSPSAAFWCHRNDHP